MKVNFKKQYGLTLVGWLVAIPAILIVLLIIVVLFYEGRIKGVSVD